jgi:hypothetical protein
VHIHLKEEVIMTDTNNETQWKRITKEEIKQVPVGGKVRINGVETVLTYHYGGVMDYGFHYRCNEDCDIFAHDDWDRIVVEIPTPECELTLKQRYWKDYNVIEDVTGDKLMILGDNACNLTGWNPSEEWDDNLMEVEDPDLTNTIDGFSIVKVYEPLFKNNPLHWLTHESGLTLVWERDKELSKEQLALQHLENKRASIERELEGLMFRINMLKREVKS